VWESKECNPGRLARYESDVRHIQEQLSRFNTFRHELPDLFSLSARDVATDDIAQALLTAETRGKKQVTDFVVRRLREDSSTFHDTLSKNMSPTLGRCIVLQ